MSGSSTGFRAKVLKSAKMSTLKYASEVGLRLISTVVLSRLLAPEVYGIFAIVLVYLYLLEMFSDFGVRPLILTKEGEVTDTFLRTCWTVSILRGVLIATVSTLIAVVIALLQSYGTFAADNPYSALALPWAVAVLGLASLMMGFQSPMRYMSEREMAFGRVTVVDVLCNVIALVVTIILAYHLRSIWALVLGNLFRSIASVTLSFWVFRGPPMRLSLDRSNLGLLIGRGKWVLGHSILTALSQSVDRLMLGFVMTSTSFGFYFIARQLVDILARFTKSMSAQMGLQVFGHIQKSNAADFRRNYYRFRLFFDAFAGLCTGGLIVLAPVLVEIVFDDRYRGVASIAQIIVLPVLLTGPLLLQEAFRADRRFKEITFLGVVSVGTLCIGLTAAILLSDNVTIALLIIALHRLPETIIVIMMARKRDWIIPWRESSAYIFCAIGALIGWLFLLLWNSLA